MNFGMRLLFILSLGACTEKELYLGESDQLQQDQAPKDDGTPGSIPGSDDGGSEEGAPVEPIDIYNPDINWIHTNVSEWDKTSIISDFDHQDGDLCYSHSKRGIWPMEWPIYDDPSQIGDPAHAMEGNAWYLAYIDGSWHAGTWEFLRWGTGRTCKYEGRNSIHEQFQGIEPFASWYPESGELVGFFISTHARYYPSPVLQERSNVVWFNWP